ncbi:MAG TPA: DUF4340 domain-containing protein [Rhizomicrobium sp.]|jgi:hypothetical protein
MADTYDFTRDRRWRNLLTLAIVALVLVVLAALSLVHESQEVAPRYEAHPFLPGLASEVRDIARIRIVSKSGEVDVQFKPDKGWVVASHDDYPASFERVHETVVGLAGLETIEPKTARSDWLHYLDLMPPPKGDGVTITLLDGQGRVLAGVVTGKKVDIGDPSGAQGLYVRQADSDQSWLVRSVLEPKTDAKDWLDKQVFDVDAARIQQVDANPLNGPSFEVRRNKRGDPDMNLLDVPKGREIAYPGAADGMANAISGFTFDDVRPAKDLDFSDSAHVARLVARTFDGLIVTVQTIQQGKDYWTVVSADGAAGQADAQRQARTIDARASGWAYKMPIYKGQQLMTSLESLLKPLPQKAAPATPAK